MANFIPKIEYVEINTLVNKSVNFDQAPEGDPFNEEFRHSTTVTTSNNGQKQTAYNYGRKYYEVEFLYISSAVKTALEDFFNNHAVRGGKFNYFIHNDEVTFEEFEIEGKNIKFSRPIPNGAGDFEYNVKMRMSKPL